LPIEKLRGAIPPTLLAVIISTVVASIMNLELNRVQLPENLLSAFAWPDLSVLTTVGWLLLLQQALTIAAVGSAETLLTANAIDRMLPAHKSNYDRELVAQGLGNTICGAVGALPVAGVIVRSSVNVKAGAKTKAATVLHGLWLLLFTLVFPFVRQIPSAALAALLVYTGYRLIDIRAAKRIAEIGKSELLIFAATAVAILVTDLFTGVVIGVTMSAVNLLYVFCKLDIQKTIVDGRITLKLIGAATFFSLPKLADALEALPTDTELHVDFSRVTYIDHASLDLLMKWEEQYKSQGGTLTIDWGLVQARFNAAAADLSERGSEVVTASH
jgi:MFS superfamily sulfate permease-like transporter